MKIREYLQKNPLLFDGAMGTYAAKKHPFYMEQGCELLNVTHPEWIQTIHEEYLQAGAVAIKTNTFAANEYSLKVSKERVQELIRQGWKLAYQACLEYENPSAGKEFWESRQHEGKTIKLREHFVFADIGPVNAPEDVDGAAIYREIVDTFLECGARNFIFETLESTDYLEEIAAYIKDKAEDAFILVSFGVSPEGFTRGGCYGRSLFYQLQQIESIDAIGFNCISGPKHLLELIQKLDLKSCNKYVSVMPNAGYPTVVSNRTFYGNNHVYFAEAMEEIAREGVAIVGGCCGTQPSYIAQIAARFQEHPVEVRALWKEKNLVAMQVEETHNGATLAKNNPKNEFAAKLSQGQKVIVVELDPPVTPDIDGFMEGAARFKKAGVDAIDIADCPIARARIDSSILACKVSRELKMAAIPHLTCRDRNINATKALLLGLNVEGVNNVLTVTGDPVPVAQRQEIKTVFSYNSAVLAKHINTFNETTFARNPFQVCGAININAHNFDSQLAHARKKIENGVNVLFTQPVMTEDGLKNLKRARKELPVKLLGGMIPVVSYRNACFMEHEIAGIRVDERIIAMYEGKDRAQGEELAVRIVSAIAEEIREYVDGFYLITPFNRIALIENILEKIKK